MSELTAHETMAPAKPKLTRKERAEKLIHFFGFTDALLAWRHPHKDVKERKRQVIINVMKKIGLADFAEALEHPTETRKKVLSSVFNRVADFAANKAVVTLLKLMMLPLILGMMAGAPALLTIGTVALATGLFCGLYSYGRDLIIDYCQLGRQAKIFSLQRFNNALVSFGISAASGAAGAWLINTDIAQGAIKWTKDTVITSAGRLSDAFNASGSMPALPAGSPGPMPSQPGF